MGDLWFQVLPRSPESFSVLRREIRQKTLTDDEIGFKYMLATDPGNPELHDGLGSLYLQHGRDPEAVDRFETSVRLNPRRAMGQYNLGTALLFQGRLVDAIAPLEEALRLKPDLIYAYNSLGYVLQRLGKIGEAMNHYRHALKLAPDYANARNNLGLALRTAGMLTEAVEQFEQAARLRPYDPIPQRNWAQVLAMQGKARDAVGRFQLALQAAPEASAVLGDLAWLLAAHPHSDIRAPEEALRLAERAAMMSGRQDPRILDVLSVAYAASQEFEQAASAARSALELAARRGNTRLAQDISERLRLFESRRPYIHDFTDDFEH
jgi:tetratricopeptide (TPR) repeat protein